MLLTCKSCGNTFIVDESQAATYRPPDCAEGTCDLAPLTGGANSEDSTSILEGYDFKSIKDQWQQQKAAQAGGGDAAVPVSGGGDDWGSGDAWGGSGGGGGDAWGGGGGGGDAWGGGHGGGHGGPPSGGHGHGGGNMAAMMQGDGGDATQAFDVDSMLGQIDRPQPPGGGAPPGGGYGGGSPGGPVGGMDDKTAALDISQIQSAMPARQQVVIGGGGGGAPPPGGAPNPYGNVQGGAPNPYGNVQGGAPNPYGRPPGPPGPYPGGPQQGYPQQQSGGAGRTILIILVVLLVLGGLGVGAYLIFSGDDESSSSSEDSGPATFTDRLEAITTAPESARVPLFAGELKTDGVLILVTGPEGVFVEGDLVSRYQSDVPTDTVSGTPFIDSLNSDLDDRDTDQPALILFDEFTPYKSVYPALYTAYNSGFRVHLAGRGSRIDAVATLPVEPHGWPGAPSSKSGPPPLANDSPVRFAISPEAIEVTIEGAEEPITINNTGGYDPTALKKAIEDGSDKSSTVKIKPSKDMKMGELMGLIETIRGDIIGSNFDVFLIEAP